MHALKRSRTPSTPPPGLTLPAERTGPPSALAPEPRASGEIACGLRMVVEGRGGALIRLLGLVERRGYQATHVKVETTPEGLMRIELSVRSERSVELLMRQLGRLVEVRTVELVH